jgi:predicted nucleotidyltransferase
MKGGSTMRQNNIEIPKEEIADFCRRWNITEVALFGSVLREDFHPDSDIDMLVTFAPGARYSLFDLARMQEELKAMLGREVNLVEKAGLRNPFRRHEILKSLKVVYAS